LDEAVKALGFAYNELDLKVLQITAHKTNVGSVKVAENYMKNVIK
jgi:ribosomal-protein-alanine N-acetyltransferase